MALLTSASIAVYTLESLIPRPLPWLRLGLSNAFILTVLLLHGVGLALSVSVLRTLLGSLLTGSFLSPGFAVALPAGITSCLVMGLAWHLSRKLVGPVGLSILGAVAHNGTQLGVAYLLFIRRPEIFALVPVFLLLSVVTGGVTGFVAHELSERMRPHPSVAGGLRPDNPRR